ncbi:hypothetical protein LBMAG42_46720 [Deltaproteobacteria bacterium]|nr:hypothetical protein LBMAG42_46720 [Deltaproteobacteria bacterium]
MLRLIVAGLCAALLALSAFGHSVIGWSVLAPEVKAAGADDEMLTTLAISWRLGGAAMLIFSALVVDTLRRHRRDARVSLAPLVIIGAGYCLYGAWAFVTSGMEPFFFVLFVVPGAVLAASGIERRDR